MWKCSKCGLELQDNETVCPCGEVKPEEITEITEEDFQETTQEAEPKVLNNKIIALACLVLAIIILTAGIFTYYLKNRYVKITGEQNTITTQDIKDTCDSIFSEDVALKVNDMAIDKDLFECFVNKVAFSHQDQFAFDAAGNFDPTQLKNFNWDEIADEETGYTHKDIVMADAIDKCVNYYSLISFAQKTDLDFFTEDDEMVNEEFNALINYFGEDYLTKYYHKSLDVVKEFFIVEGNKDLVLNHITMNMSEYIDEDMSVFNFTDATDIAYYAKKTAKVSLNKDILDNFEIKIDYEGFYNMLLEKNAQMLAEAEAAEAELAE